jgi:hypothetical protein
VISVAKVISNNALPRYTSHLSQSEVSGRDEAGRGDEDATSPDDSNSGVGEGFVWAGTQVVKAPTTLQALEVLEPIALTFQ